MKRALSGPAVGILLLALIVLLALIGLAEPPTGADEEGSIDSTEPEGRRALALVADRLGFAAEGWRSVPAALPHGRHALAMARTPDAGLFDREAGVETGGRSRPEPGLARVGMHDLEHYAAFVRAGGTIVVAGEEGLAFAAEELGLAGARDLALEPYAPDDTSLEPAKDVRLATGERVQVWVPRAFAPLEAGSAARAWASVTADSGDEHAVVVEVPEGEGRVLLLADGAFLDNEYLGEHDNPLLAVRLLEHARRGGRLLFDEYALGLWVPAGPLDVATRAKWLLLTLHVAALALAWAWSRAAPRAFARDPEPLDAFSPLLRARAQARLFERARRFELLAEPLRESALAHLCRRARLKRAREPAAALLARIGAALGEPVERRARELLDRPVRSRTGLARLDADVSALLREASA